MSHKNTCHDYFFKAKDAGIYPHIPDKVLLQKAIICSLIAMLAYRTTKRNKQSRQPFQGKLYTPTAIARVKVN